MEIFMENEKENTKTSKKQKNLLDNYPSHKDIIDLTEEECLHLRNLNLQIMLADKSIENLDLKKNIFLKEKQDVLNELNIIKNNIALKNNSSLDDYLFDIPNKRIVHKRLVQQT
jgi:hypothetical protein